MTKLNISIKPARIWPFTRPSKVRLLQAEFFKAFAIACAQGNSSSIREGMGKLIEAGIFDADIKESDEPEDDGDTREDFMDEEEEE